MKRTFPRQLKYDLYIGNSDKPSTDFVYGEVRVTADESMMGTLSFEIKDPDVHADWIRMGTAVRFYGGYLEKSNPLDRPKDGGGYRLLFSGNVFKVNIKDDGAGNPIGVVTCIDAFYRVGGYSQKVLRYPSNNNPRATGDIRVSEIVKNVCDDLGVEVEISLGKNSDVTYTRAESVVQNEQSDWAFLVYLANRVGAYCWTAIENDKTKVYFVDQSKAFSNTSKIEFVGIGRKAGNFFVGSYSGKTEVNSEAERLKDNQVMLTSYTVTEDPGMYGQHIYKLTDYSSEDGEKKELLAKFDEDLETITYYELDSALIEAMNKTETGRAELNRLLQMGALSIPWSEAQKYYKEIIIPAGKLDAIGGMGFMGVTISARCIGDLRVVPYKSYNVLGIVRARNMNRRGSKFYLKSLVHVFSNEGYNIDLEFIA